MNGDLLRIIDTLHRDKAIEKEVIFEGIEAGILSAVKKRFINSEPRWWSSSHLPRRHLASSATARVSSSALAS